MLDALIEHAPDKFSSPLRLPLKSKEVDSTKAPESVDRDRHSSPLCHKHLAWKQRGQLAMTLQLPSANNNLSRPTASSGIRNPSTPDQIVKAACVKHICPYQPSSLFQLHRHLELGHFTLRRVLNKSNATDQPQNRSTRIELGEAVYCSLSLPTLRSSVNQTTKIINCPICLPSQLSVLAFADANQLAQHYAIHHPRFRSQPLTLTNATNCSVCFKSLPSCTLADQHNCLPPREKTFASGPWTGLNVLAGLTLSPNLDSPLALASPLAPVLFDAIDSCLGDDSSSYSTICRAGVSALYGFLISSSMTSSTSSTTKTIAANKELTSATTAVSMTTTDGLPPLPAVPITSTTCSSSLIAITSVDSATTLNPTPTEVELEQQQPAMVANGQKRSLKSPHDEQPDKGTKRPKTTMPDQLRQEATQVPPKAVQQHCSQVAPIAPKPSWLNGSSTSWNNMLPCEVCQRLLAPSHLLNHYSVEHKIKIHTIPSKLCVQCGQLFFTEQGLYWHVGLKCSLCPIDICRSTYYTHMLYHHLNQAIDDLNALSCKPCSAKFADIDFLLRHLVDRHATNLFEPRLEQLRRLVADQDNNNDNSNDDGHHKEDKALLDALTVLCSPSADVHNKALLQRRLQTPPRTRSSTATTAASVDTKALPTYACTICTRRFASIKHLDAHMMATDHQYQCRFCPEKFLKHCTMVSHCLTAHRVKETRVNRLQSLLEESSSSHRPTDQPPTSSTVAGHLTTTDQLHSSSNQTGRQQELVGGDDEDEVPLVVDVEAPLLVDSADDTGLQVTAASDDNPLVIVDDHMTPSDVVSQPIQPVSKVPVLSMPSSTTIVPLIPPSTGQPNLVKVLTSTSSSSSSTSDQLSVVGSITNTTAAIPSSVNSLLVAMPSATTVQLPISSSQANFLRVLTGGSSSSTPSIGSTTTIATTDSVPVTNKPVTAALVPPNLLQVLTGSHINKPSAFNANQNTAPNNNSRECIDLTGSHVASMTQAASRRLSLLEAIQLATNSAIINNTSNNQLLSNSQLLSNTNSVELNATPKTVVGSVNQFISCDLCPVFCLTTSDLLTHRQTAHPEHCQQVIAPPPASNILIPSNFVAQNTTTSMLRPSIVLSSNNTTGHHQSFQLPQHQQMIGRSAAVSALSLLSPSMAASVNSLSIPSADPTAMQLFRLNSCLPTDNQNVLFNASAAAPVTNNLNQVVFNAGGGSSNAQLLVCPLCSFSSLSRQVIMQHISTNH